MTDLIATPTFRSQAQEVFFEAMNAGYAAEGKPKKGSIAELPGSKTLTYIRDSWVVLDVYQVTPISLFSGGTTHIWYEGVEVWMMQYFGWYYAEAILCLKTALRKSYAKKEFCGGRGPTFLETKAPKLHYMNKPDECSFDWFHGVETIETPGGATMGIHRYQGGLMILE
ncbi:MAG: DUF5680 domain-containing protein [Candidatus Paceibacterota bacterium]